MIWVIYIICKISTYNMIKNFLIVKLQIKEP